MPASKLYAPQVFWIRTEGFFMLSKKIQTKRPQIVLVLYVFFIAQI
jgi:hypothetical protein